MYNLNQNIHFVGVGGVGMAGIAELLSRMGYSVSGSDIKPNNLTTHLESIGVEVFIGHKPDNIPEETSAVVYSTAIPVDNPELVEAEKRGVVVIRRAVMLAELMRMRYGIAVGGSHGKTTTTSMIAHVLKMLGLDPTVAVGGRFLSASSGASLGAGKFLVAEADESDGSFSLLRPAISVVTNIDYEHIDHYKSFEKLEEAFLGFINSVPFYGLSVVCNDCENLQKVIKQTKRRFITYGTSDDSFVKAENVNITESGSDFQLSIDGKEVGKVFLPVFGEHMVLNSLAAISISHELGLSITEVIEALQSYPGVSRRSELICTINEVSVVDDYAHHPSEIKATLAALRKAYIESTGAGKLLCVFQPHRYSRTKELFDDFANSFSDADELLVLDIYPAGEKEIVGVNSDSLTKAISSASSAKVNFVGDFESAKNSLRELARPGDVIVTLGAGSIGSFSKELKVLFMEPDTKLQADAV